MDATDVAFEHVGARVQSQRALRTNAPVIGTTDGPIAGVRSAQSS
jgi:hypothetical protein